MWLAVDGGCWLVAWLAWVDGVLSAWRRERPGLDRRERVAFWAGRVPMALFLALCTWSGLVSGVWRVAWSDY